MNLSMEAWGGGLIVVLAAILWLAYFLPSLWRKQNESAQDKLAPQLAKLELRRLKLKEREAKARYMQMSQTNSARPAGSSRYSRPPSAENYYYLDPDRSSPALIFRQVVGWCVVGFFLLGLGSVIGGFFGYGLLFLWLAIGPFVLSVLLALRLRAVAVRRRQAPRQSQPRLKARVFDMPAEATPKTGKTWQPVELPKPVYLAPSAQANVRPGVDVEKLAKKALAQAQADRLRRQEAELETLAQTGAIPLRQTSPSKTGSVVEAEVSNRLEKMGVLDESDGLINLDDAFRKRCTG